MLHNVRLLSSYLKAISTWPEDGESTIKSMPSPYQIARKINISANSSYKMWNLIFEKEYIKDILIMPQTFPGNFKRYYLIASLPFEYVKDVENKLQKIPYVEMLNSTDYQKKRRGSQGIENYSEIGSIQFISSENRIKGDIDNIGNSFRDSGLEFNVMNHFSNSEETDPSTGQLNLIKSIAYKSVKNFSTEEITNQMNYSRKRTRKNLDTLVKNRFIKGNAIFNFRKIPNIITKQLIIMVPEEATSSYVMWLQTRKEIRDNLIYFTTYPYRFRLIIFGENMQELDDIMFFLSQNFNEIFIIDRFETTFFDEVKPFFRGIYDGESE